MTDVNVNKLRKALGLSQQAVADKATVTRSVIGEVEGRRKGLSVAAATKAAPVLGIGPSVLYLGTQLVAIKAKVEEQEITEEQAADKLLRVLRTCISKFEEIEDEDGANELIDQLEELLAEYTGNAVSTARGEKGAAVSKKNAGLHPAFVKSFKQVGTSAPRPEDYTVNDSRDLYGRAISLPADLRDPHEHEFEDISSFGTANEYAYDDEDDLEGRDSFGRRTGRLDGQGR